MKPNVNTKFDKVFLLRVCMTKLNLCPLTEEKQAQLLRLLLLGLHPDPSK